MRQGTRASIRRFNLAAVVTAAVVGGGVLVAQPLGPSATPGSDAVLAAKTLTPSRSVAQASSVKAQVETLENASPARSNQVATREFARSEEPQVLAPAPAPIELIPPPSFSFQIATHNVLGNSHTSGKGRRKGFAGSGTRMGYTVNLLNSYGVDVVGLQELQRVQFDMFRGRMPGWGVYPGLDAGPLGIENSIAWNASMFDLVEAYTITVPYFGGRPRPMPVIRLREPETEREFWVANFHNPADTHGNAARWRGAATNIQINLINRLRAETELPVFITGDMNERESWFCRVTAGANIASMAGGGVGSPCRPPSGPNPVDWLMATTDVQVTGYHDVRSGLITRTSDHPLLVGTALLEE